MSNPKLDNSGKSREGQLFGIDSHVLNRDSRFHLLSSYHNREFNLIPLRPRSKIPLVKWKDYRLTDKDLLRFLGQSTNWAIRCDENFHALDFDDIETYTSFIQGKGTIFKDAPTIRTSRGYHIWFRPMRPVNSFRGDGIEVKGLGSLVVIPPSVHPNGTKYHFEKPLNGKLPEIDIEKILGSALTSQTNKKQPSIDNIPTDFALRYGKSPYPQSLCGKATKVLTRSDGGMKHLLSLRCWKWHCSKCAPLLKRYWFGRLESISFRFILRLPTMNKPTAFLRHINKPGYTHIVANGESWLFLIDGESEKVWAEASRAGYELIAGDVSGDPSPDEIRSCLEQALCLEEEPLNTRRKLSHSRELFKKIPQSNMNNESKQKDDCVQEDEDMKAVLGREPPAWNSQVVMKPIEKIARELEQEGWHIFWESEVEAFAIKNKALEDVDIIEFVENLGVKLKKIGKEYMGWCPFHNDHNPSLSVNRERGLWHCFGCGRSGDVRRFIEEWRKRRPC
jgi:hypothetical protein